MSAYVEWIQESLQALGYEPGPVDGVNGEKTDAAIRRFQTDQQLEVDGLVGENTHTALLVALNVSIPHPGDADQLQLKNFAADEFACSCGCGLDVCDRLKVFAQNLRDFFGWPLTISSGGRSRPPRGVWIETLRGLFHCAVCVSRPPRGVWIETF